MRIASRSKEIQASHADVGIGSAPPPARRNCCMENDGYLRFNISDSSAVWITSVNGSSSNICSRAEYDEIEVGTLCPQLTKRSIAGSSSSTALG